MAILIQLFFFTRIWLSPSSLSTYLAYVIVSSGPSEERINRVEVVELNETEEEEWFTRRLEKAPRIRTGPWHPVDIAIFGSVAYSKADQDFGD